MDTKTNNWFYDELSILFQKKEIEDSARIKKMQRMVTTKFGAGNPFTYTLTNDTYGEVISIPFSCPDEFRPYAEVDLENFAKGMRFRLNFGHAHPFLIGPATLESLLDKPVDNYDYISEGKLPFNPLFFEFTDYIPATIPKVKRSEVSLHGIYLFAPLSNGPKDYVFTSFWKDNKREIMGIDLFMNDPKSTLFHGQVSHLSGSNFALDELKSNKNRYQFVINTTNNQMYIARTAEKEIALYEAMRKHGGELVDFTKLFDESIPLDSIQSNVFSMIPSLSTNLINYINSHNITIVTNPRITSSETRVSSLPNNKKYSVIRVRDEVHHESLTHHQGQLLTYRLAVRGHNRRLRDEKGQIVKTSWISPYIKGPEGAPFFDTRHEVTANKILAERELFKHR